MMCIKSAFLLIIQTKMNARNGDTVTSYVAILLAASSVVVLKDTSDAIRLV